MNLRLSAVLFLLSGGAFAQGFAGTWTAKDVTITLTQSEDQISGAIVTDRKQIEIGGVVDGNEATGEVNAPNGTASFTMSLAGQALKFQMTGPDGKTVKFFLKRSKGAPTPTPAPEPRQEKMPAPPPPPTGTTPPGAAAGRWWSDDEGWSLHAPPGWKGGFQKDGSVMLGHDTELGLLRINHELGSKLEDVRARGEGGFALEGVQFTLTSAITPLKVKAGPAFEADYQGQSMQGPMRVHTVALQAPAGVLFVTGMAPGASFGKLAQHTQAMAASVAFSKPRIGNAMRVVAGRWWHWHGSSSVGYGNNSSSTYLSSEKKLWLCPDGRFSRQGQFSVDSTVKSETFGNSYANANNNSNADGRWTAVGTPQAGKIIVTFQDGSRQELPYQAPAPGDKFELYVDGVGYLRSNDIGGCN